MVKKTSGELHVWRKLSGLDPSIVSNRANVTFDKQSMTYTLHSFGCNLGIDLKYQKIFEYPNACNYLLLEKLDSGLILSVLWYLISAKDIPLSNKLIRPASLPGGQIFVKGSHILPLNEVAEKYGNSPEKLVEQGEKYGGVKSIYGDASIELFPYPRMPVVIVLWEGDDEFPTNVDILLDESCVLQIPLDIIWSTCLMSVQVIL